MSFRRSRAALLFVGLLLPMLASCAAAEAGSPQPAASSARLPAASSAAPTTGSSSAWAPPSTPEPPTAESPGAGAPAAPSGTAARSGAWTSAQIELGGVGFPSPSGDLSAVLRGGQVCFDSGTGPGPCGDLAPGDQPVFMVFSPDGRRLLLVAGPDERATAAYVLDAADARVRVVGPAGISDDAAAPARWDPSSAAWSSDGSAVVLVPHTAGDAGPALSVDLESGAVTEIFRMPADLANGRPSIWPTRDGTAVVGTAGVDVQTVWWADRAGGELRSIGRFDQPDGSLTLAAADPLGRSVLVCPRRSDGRWGATVGIAVQTGESARILTDSTSCAGAVFSADGQYAAMTATVDSGYNLIIVDLAAARRVLTVPLPVAEPLSPPHLTWLADTVVIADSSGEWRSSSLVVRLR
jgi:hypothetical protein